MPVTRHSNRAKRGYGLTNAKAKGNFQTNSATENTAHAEKRLKGYTFPFLYQTVSTVELPGKYPFRF